MNQSYSNYISSPAWRAKRQEFFGKRPTQQDRCHFCHREGPVDIHHRSYERFQAEHVTDLVAACRWCHTRIHKLVRMGVPLRQATKLYLHLVKKEHIRGKVKQGVSGLGPPKQS